MDRSAAPLEKRKTNTLWVVTELYYPELTSTGYYLTAIAESLGKVRDVKVLTGQPTYAARGQIAPKRETRHGVEIFRAWGTRLNKDVPLFRLVNMSTIAVSIFAKALALFRKGDQVLVVTAPQSLPVTTAAAALTRGASYTLLVHDSYPETMIAVGTVRPKSAIVSFINLINRWVYKYSSRIIVMGRDMNELFQKKTAGLNVPIETIPNWAELETLRPSDRSSNKLIQELGLTNKIIFLFAGNLGRPIDLETLVSAAERLGDNEGVHFIFLGSGAKRKWLEETVRHLKLTNVTLLDARPRSEQQEFLNACDVGIVSLVKGMLGNAMPSKTYNLMAVGKPILAVVEPGSEAARIVEEEGIGWCVWAGDVDGLDLTLCRISKNRATLSILGARARAAAESRYSMDVAMKAYIRALK